MIGAIETATLAFLENAAPGPTALASRDAQSRTLLIATPDAFSGTIAFRATFGQTVIEFPRPAASPQTAADLTVSKLLSFEQFDRNWDGNDAAKPDPQSIQAARFFIRSLSPGSKIPEPTLHANGNVLLFVNEGDRYAEIEFVDGNRIEFYARQGDHQWSDEVSFDGGSLPAGLPEIGFSI